MIITTSPSFYIIRAVGEAAELITSVFSPGSMGDIIDVSVLSKEFDNDIEPINEMDETLRTIKSGLGSDLVENVTFNPLFIPMSIDSLDDVLDVEVKGDRAGFTGMSGNQYAIKNVEFLTGPEHDEDLLFASVSYQQFDLPSYDFIIDRQQNSLLN